MRITRRSLVLSVALLAAGVTATANAAVDAALIAAAKKEGEVSWYSSLVVNQASRPIAAAFEKKYPGIKVKITSGTATDLLLKIMAEGRANSPRADVSHAGSGLSTLLKGDMIVPYIPSEAARYPAQYKDAKGYWTGQVVSFLVPAMNTDLVKPKDEPKTWNDLLDPKWKGKMAWAQQMTQGGPPGFIGATLNVMGQQKGMDFLRKFSQQRIVNVPANQRVVLDQAIAGEYPIALSTFSHHSELSAKKGAPIKWLKMDYVVGTVDPAFLIKNGPHPNAARLFLEFLLSSEGQAIFRSADYIPADPAVPASIPGLKPETGHFKAVFLPLSLVDADMPKWINIYNELFK
ncbi:extracellular solute-binding protein [Herbaspirillum lusitanum]|uniref:Extracellular solute-binding protein n=1 Tax=Herbaspirillum lusitanum TaxID=213312 RepID=A0ABW9ADN3_9BURK